MIINQYDKQHEILENIKRVKDEVASACAKAGRDPADVRMMAVTKTIEPYYVNLAIREGICLLGENRVQEFLSKQEAYELQNTEVHFIGHLQTNKVKQIIDRVSMIESVSSVRLADEINRCAKNCGRVMDVLLEVNIGREESKTGFLEEDLMNQLDYLGGLSNLRIKGLMCIPPKENAEKFFRKMTQLSVDIRTKKIDNIDMNLLSMGMSGDYKTAIAHGSNIVRLGTALFGARARML